MTRCYFIIISGIIIYYTRGGRNFSDSLFTEALTEALGRFLIRNRAVRADDGSDAGDGGGD